MMLAELPHLALYVNIFLSSLQQTEMILNIFSSLFAEAKERFGRLLAFTDELEKATTKNLMENILPTPAFTEQVSVAKVAGVETGIELCHRLQQEIGSYAYVQRVFCSLNFN